MLGSPNHNGGHVIEKVALLRADVDAGSHRSSLERVLEQQAGDDVGVDVGGGAAVLQVAVALEHDGQRDADRGAAVSHT